MQSEEELMSTMPEFGNGPADDAQAPQWMEGEDE